MATHDTAQLNRFEAFSLTQDEWSLLRERASDYARDRLPALLEGLHSRFGKWPEIQSALMDPDVHRVRLAHWQRVASGSIGEGFMASARALATALYARGVPAYAVTICHSIVLNGIIRDLLLDLPCTRLTSLKASTAKHNFRIALQKAAWYDLEVLLETYAEAEKASRREATEAVARSFEVKMQGVVQELDQSAQEFARTAGQIASTADNSVGQADMAADAAGHANSGVQTMAAAAEELSASIGEINRRIEQSTDMTERAVRSAQQTNGVVQALSEGASRIGDVVKLISSIAGQTNLLALNATIEAARAGDAGKGFTVVASEVKNLASQTAKATEEITRQIDQNQAATRQAVDAIRDIAGIIDEISEATAAIAAAVQEQGSATGEIAQSAARAAAHNLRVEQLMSDVRAGAGSSATGATSLSNAAKHLSENSQALNKALQGFLREVRAT